MDVFLHNALIYNQISQLLPSFPDLDRCLNTLIAIPKQKNTRTASITIDSLIMLKTSIKLSLQLGDMIDTFSLKLENNHPCFSLLSIISSNLKHDDLRATADLIDSYIADSSFFTKNCYEMKQTECFALKSGLNTKLDVSRMTYLDSVEHIHSLATEYSVTSICCIHRGIMLRF